MDRVSWQSLLQWSRLVTRCSWTWSRSPGPSAPTRRCTVCRSGTPTCCRESKSSSRGLVTSSFQPLSGWPASSTPSPSSPPSCSRWTIDTNSVCLGQRRTRTAPLCSYKCTKHQFIYCQFIYLLSATFKQHLRTCTSKTAKITKGDIARITLTVCQSAAE